MEVRVAESAGFCFGVNRAVEKVYSLLAEGKKVCTLGPIIHNPHVINDMSVRGVRIAENEFDVNEGETLVIRSHGVPDKVVVNLLKSGVRFVDATCPYVKKIHAIVSDDEGFDALFIAGDEDHPEVAGIIGNTALPTYCFSTMEELTKTFKKIPYISSKRIKMVAQTTFNVKFFENFVNYVKKECTNPLFFDTICKATQERQSEAILLSNESDVMLIIGGRDSSNTRKLFSVSRDNCQNTYFIESAQDLKVSMFAGGMKIGVTAGASAPVAIIKEVLNRMSEIFENAQENENVTDAAPVLSATDDTEVKKEASDSEPSFEEQLEESLKNFNTDQKVKGVVLAVLPTEIHVDIGRKQTGFVKLSELTADPFLKPADIVSVGDVLDLVIMKTNDVDGMTELSKRRHDARAGWTEIVEMADNKDAVLSGTIIDAVRGGVIVLTPKGGRVFIPASQASDHRVEDLSELLKQEVEFKLLDVDKDRRRAVGSIRATIKGAGRGGRKPVNLELLNSLVVGENYEGTVKTLTSFGAFIDLGGVDGMAHVSELSWKRIKHPSEVLNVGDTVTVTVKAVDLEKQKVSLIYKKREDNPWEVLRAKYTVGDVADVKIVGVAAFGAFAELVPGIDGLIHISQLSDRRVETPQEAVKIGQLARVKITEIDFDKKRISLSIRALLEGDNAFGLSEDVTMPTDADESVAQVITEDVPVPQEIPAGETASEEASAGEIASIENIVSEDTSASESTEETLAGESPEE